MKRTIQVAFAIWLLAALSTQSAFAAASTPTDSRGDSATMAAPVAGATGQMDTKTYEGLKKALDKHPDFSRADSIVGDTRTLTYTYLDGSKVVLAEPARGRTGGIAPQLSVGGCGWFTVCVWLDQSEQAALIAGGAAFLGVVLCTAFPPACPFTSAALAGAAAWLTYHPLCQNYLVIEVLPFPGTFKGCY